MPWKVLDKKFIAKSNFHTLYQDEIELPNGRKMKYTRFNMPDFVVIVPITSDGKIVMERNYRYPIDEYALELPAGIIDGGEEPKECAVRELKEETGYTAGKMEQITWYYPISALNDQKGYVFIASELQEGEPQQEDSEEMTIEHYRIEDVFKLFNRGEIKHSPSMVALAVARDRLLK